MKWILLFVFAFFIGFGLLMNGILTPTEENPADWSAIIIFRLAYGSLGFCMLMASLMMYMQRSAGGYQYPTKALRVLGYVGVPLAFFNILSSFILFMTHIIRAEVEHIFFNVPLITFPLHILMMYFVWSRCVTPRGKVVKFNDQLYYEGEQFYVNPLNPELAIQITTKPEIQLQDLEITCQEGRQLNLSGTVSLVLNYGRKPRQVDLSALREYYIEWIKQQIIVQTANMSIFDILENKWQTETGEFLSVQLVWNGKSNLMTRVV